MLELLATELSLSFVSWEEASLRIFLAAFLGFVLGIDRDMKNKPIDFRAYMIIAVSTCAIAMTGQEVYASFQNSEEFLSLDLGKVISGSLTGIGFLGAGAIIHRGDNRVIGTATGAAIWAAGGIGLALGFGVYALAFMSFLAVWLILFFGGLGMEHFTEKTDHHPGTEE